MKRLPREYYRGHAFVHWSMTIDGRATNWLGSATHGSFREVLLHAQSRFALFCPIYCLMPDHLHFLWFGLGEGSDQHAGATFVRRHMNRVLGRGGCRFQRQPWDVVLREKDREREAVTRAVFYIAENPVRAGLIDHSAAWEYSGSLAVGYPDFDWRENGYAEKMWRIYELQVERSMNGAERVNVPVSGAVTGSAPVGGDGAERVNVPASGAVTGSAPVGGDGAERVNVP